MASDPLPSEIGLARTCAERLLPHVDAETGERLAAARWGDGQVQESGQFHRVLVLPDVAVLRMTRMAEAGAAPGTGWAPDDSPAVHLPRRMRLLQALAARGLRPTEVEDSISADRASADEAAILEIAEGDPVLRHARRAVSDGRIVEVSRTCYRHDRFTVYLQLNDR